MFRIKYFLRNNLLRPNELTQRDILAGAISDLLWKVSGSCPAVLAIPEANPVFEAPVRFSIDGLTEKLHLFKCNKEEELKNVVKRHIYYVGPHLYDLVSQKYFPVSTREGRRSRKFVVQHCLVQGLGRVRNMQIISKFIK